MSNFLYALISVVLVSAVSLIGAAALVISENKLKRFIHYFISFAVGALLGEVFLHLLPEMSEFGFSRLQGIYILFGVLLFLVLEKLILWHHSHTDHEESVHAVVWLTLIGDGVHNVLDGMLIAATYIVSIPLGIATTIAVLFHEIPHELGDFMVLIHGGLKSTKALWFNFLSALTSVIGMLFVYLFAREFTHTPQVLLGVGVASFLYIAMADLIPELNQEKKLSRSILQFIYLIIGIVTMAGLLLLEK